ncbi:MAG: ArnT family glycosyltransferase [Isosphaeraceae bacterium]
MTDLLFTGFLALIGLGTGKRILDRFGQAPEHPFDATALALPLGMGVMALGTLALGGLGWLNRLGLSVLLALLMELGLFPAVRLLRELGRQGRDPDPSKSSMVMASCLGVALLGTGLVAVGPVTDGDALCYHLQVPKTFLMHGSLGFDPDLHETVYPLVTELIYLPALEFRGPGACRWIQWVLGLVLFANVTALARPSLGRRAWWAGTIMMLTPAISNGMSAPLNDVALAAFGTAAIYAWTRMLDRPSFASAALAGVYAGLAIGVKYPALVLFAMLTAGTAFRSLGRSSRDVARPDRSWLAMAAMYIAATLLIGGWWYLRAYLHTGNPVYPFFRHAFGGAGLDEVLDPIKRPMAVTPWNLLLSLIPLTLQPDRFDSFSHQFGPTFLLFLPAALLTRPPRRVIGLAALGYLFLMICLTQRQSMRFVLIGLGPMAIAIAYGASIWCDRTTLPARVMVSVLLAALGVEAAWAVARSRHVIGVVTGRESAEALLARREPTYLVGRWAGQNLPASARLIGQDHRGFYIPRPYTMELAHRRRTGLGRRGESPEEIVARLCESGFTHMMLCPPVPETAVEFDPTLGRLLAPWLAVRTPIYHEDLTDSDGVLRRYAIYELSSDRLASRPREGPRR